jgi:ubiquinone/menaquinone biosynthesis C-methylase UbiE
MSVVLRLALQEQRAEELAARVRRLLGPFTGTELALDSGSGTGSLAAALAPLVGKVVGTDTNLEYLAAARALGLANAEFVEGDATKLPFDDYSFDLSCSRRTLHHLARPELAVAELARVTARGGRVFVDDQIAPVDPLAALDLDRFERARDPSHTRTLPDIDLRHLFEANGLVLERTNFQSHRRELGYYLDLAGCEGDQRQRAVALSPGGPAAYTAESAWYLLRKP